MNNFLRRASARVAAALLALALPAGGQTAAPPQRATLNAGLHEAPLAERLQRDGFSKEQADRLLAYVAAARQSGFPPEALLSRLDEGVAKRVPAGAVVDAVKARLDRMETAKTLLADARYGDVSREPCRTLLTSAARALESGLPAEVLRPVLARGEGRFALRMASVMEAGEALHLIGLGNGTVQALLEDCLDRHLGRMEILRAVSYVTQQHRAGQGEAEIRASLWGTPGGTNDAARGPGGGRGGPAHAMGDGCLPPTNRP